MTETRAEQLTPKGGLNLFEKIAVCLDGSELAEQIIPYAAEQASRFRSTLVLIRVVADPIFTRPGVPGLRGCLLSLQGSTDRSRKRNVNLKHTLREWQSDCWLKIDFRQKALRSGRSRSCCSRIRSGKWSWSGGRGHARAQQGTVGYSSAASPTTL